MTVPPPILLVDDDPDDSELAQLGLTRYGLTNPIVRVTDGREALDYLLGRGDYSDRAQLPAFVLLDMKMPGMSGPELLQHVVTLPELADLLIVCLTPAGQADDLPEPLRRPRNVYAMKPVTLPRVLKAIQRARAIAVTLARR